MKIRVVVFVSGNFFVVDHATEQSLKKFVEMLYEAKNRQSWFRWIGGGVDADIDGAKIDGWYCTKPEESTQQKLLGILKKQAEAEESGDSWKGGDQ